MILIIEANCVLIYAVANYAYHDGRAVERLGHQLWNEHILCSIFPTIQTLSYTTSVAKIVAFVVAFSQIKFHRNAFE